MSRRESVGRVRAASQSESGPPTVRMVSCAVLPPRLPAGMAPPTGIGMADAISFDERLNWDHNNPIQEEEPSRRKSLFRKAGLTTQRKRANEDDDIPPFIMRQIPYDTWRKHYAKDKDGNYRGTHAPAEDCLLKPEDVQKWRLGDAVTRADKWTRGREALPVYSEVREEGSVPEYQVDDLLSQDSANQPVITPEDDQLADYIQRRDTTSSHVPPLGRPLFGAAIPESPYQRQPPQTMADGNAGEPKLTWKQKVHKGLQMASMVGTPPSG